MPDEHSVNSAPEGPAGAPVSLVQSATASSVRWWQRRPALGVFLALAIGLIAQWLLRTLGSPSNSHAAAFIYMVTLPIALLLPAGATAAAMLAWSSLAASHGLARAVLAVPAAAAIFVSLVAIGLFVRFVLTIFAY